MELSTIEQARKRIEPHVMKTPLSQYGPFFLKCEQLQRTKSFKVRGAFNAMLQLSSKRGVVTRSSGNFASAIAYAGQKLGVPVTIVMPENVPQAKLHQTKQFGPKIVLRPSRREEEETVDEIAHKENLVKLSPYDHLEVIAGQGTMGLEIFEDLPEVTHLFCPIGGGGLMSGVACALKKLKPSIKTIGIEPEGANDYYLSRQTGKKIKLETVNTIADGLRAPTVGELNYPLLNQFVDRVELVSDDSILATMRILQEKLDLTIEPSGAAALAGALAHPELTGPVAVILSGGNLDPSL